MAFLDPPYNVKISDVVGRGARKHREFTMASGEMNPAAFGTFLGESLGVAAGLFKGWRRPFCLYGLASRR